MPNQAALTSTTQAFLDIHDISNDLLIMKDGSTSLILSVNAMNFGLLAEEEQDAIIYSYAGLLNSLNYPIQIVIRSQTKDATKYLNLLKEQEEKASSDSKRRAIAQYRGFVADLIRERNVLDKKFYVVIPANALEMGLLPPQTVVPGIKSIDISSVERSVILEKARNILEPKRDHLIAQFGRIGLFSRQLTTQEIIQLFYASYNPEASEGQQLTETMNYTTAVVEAQNNSMVFTNPNDPAKPITQTIPVSPGPMPASQEMNPGLPDPMPIVEEAPTAPPVQPVAPQPQPEPSIQAVPQPVPLPPPQPTTIFSAQPSMNPASPVPVETNPLPPLPAI